MGKRLPHDMKAGVWVPTHYICWQCDGLPATLAPRRQRQESKLASQMT